MDAWVYNGKEDNLIYCYLTNIQNFYILDKKDICWIVVQTGTKEWFSFGYIVSVNVNETNGKKRCINDYDAMINCIANKKENDVELLPDIFVAKRID